MSYHVEDLQLPEDQVHWSSWTTRAPRRGISVAYLLAGAAFLLTLIVLIAG